MCNGWVFIGGRGAAGHTELLVFIVFFKTKNLSLQWLFFFFKSVFWICPSRDQHQTLCVDKDTKDCRISVVLGDMTESQVIGY